MKNWITMMALATAASGCAMNASDEELLDGEDIASLEQPVITQAEKNAITAKAASKSLGASTSDYAEYNGGVRRKYQNGVGMYSRSVNAAFAMVRDQYELWTWIGKGGFGWPNKDSYTSPTNSKVRVSRGPRGFILSTTDNVTDDAWPLMNNVYGSIQVNGDYGWRSIYVQLDDESQLDVDVRVIGNGFPPNASVSVGISHVNNPGPRRTVTTNANGSFNIVVSNVRFNQIATYNDIATVWARTTSKEHAAVWSGWLTPLNTGYAAENVLN
jgi:hypothetical protein